MRYYNFLISANTSVNKSNTNLTIICYGGEYRILYKYSYSFQKEHYLFNDKYKEHINNLISKQTYNKKRMFFTISDKPEVFNYLDIGVFIADGSNTCYADRYFASEVFLQDLYK